LSSPASPSANPAAPFWIATKPRNTASCQPAPSATAHAARTSRVPMLLPRNRMGQGSRVAQALLPERCIVLASIIGGASKISLKPLRQECPRYQNKKAAISRRLFLRRGHACQANQG